MLVFHVAGLHLKVAQDSCCLGAFNFGAQFEFSSDFTRKANAHVFQVSEVFRRLLETVSPERRSPNSFDPLAVEVEFSSVNYPTLF